MLLNKHSLAIPGSERREWGRRGRTMKRHEAVAGVMVSAFLISACATGPMSQRVSWQPLVDTAKTGDGWYKDQYECQQLADQGAMQSQIQAEKQMWEGILGGALLGAGLGAALGGVGGHAGRGAAYGSILGTAAGAGSATHDATTDYKQVFRNCLRGRGYQVLN